MVVKITNYGAKIEQILVPDKQGKVADVVQGYESIDRALGGQGSMGAFVGRYANRIGGAKFTLDGKEYLLAKNSGENNLHGGQKGSRFCVYDAHQINDAAVEMFYTYKDGEENFPGTLASRVLYEVTEDNALVVDYQAYAVDKNTVANFTTHPFFNLSGDAGQSARLHDRVEVVLEPLGIPRESRAFTPHVTVARVKRFDPSLLPQIRAVAQATFGTCTVNGFSFKKSTLTPNGPLYENILEVRC